MTWGLKLENEEQLKLVVCTPQAQKPPILESFLSQLKGQTTLIRTDVEKFSDIYPLISQDEGALILLSVLSKDDLPEILQLLAKLEPKLANGTDKIIVYNQLNNEKLVALLKSKGVTEVLESNVSLKAFQYKFNKITQLLHQAVKRAKNAKENSANSNQNKTTIAGGKQKRPIGQVVFSDPIEHFSDFWLLMNPKHVRFVIGKWFVNFYGPGPNSGEWVSYPETKNGEQGWMWNPRKAEDQTFYKDTGRWVFFGNCPEFSWEEKFWYFISKTPEFSFYVDKKVQHTKISVKENGDVDFHNNSKIGMGLQGLIDESIEASIRLNDNTKIAKSADTITKEKEKAAVDYRDKEPEEKEYGGRFAAEFEERKNKHNKNYECSELSLNLTGKNGQKIEIKTLIELIELREKYVVLDVPAGMLVVDDQIELEAFIVENGVEKRVTINAATQIVETESDDDASDHEPRALAICELNDAITPQFVALIKAFSDRREEMSDFFNKAKGVA